MASNYNYPIKHILTNLETFPTNPLAEPLLINQPIAKGGYGTIYKVFMNGQIFARKVFSAQDESQCKKNFEKEFENAAPINNPFIVKVIVCLFLNHLFDSRVSTSLHIYHLFICFGQ